MPFMDIVVLAAQSENLALQLWHPVQAQQQRQTQIAINSLASSGDIANRLFNWCKNLASPGHLTFSLLYVPADICK